MSAGVKAISKERERQVKKEGWTPDHDARYRVGTLSDAAACYAIAAGEIALHGRCNPPNPSLWPWSIKWWKPSEDPARNLEKAGALIAAEIDNSISKSVKTPDYLVK